MRGGQGRQEEKGNASIRMSSISTRVYRVVFFKQHTFTHTLVHIFRNTFRRAGSRLL